ncbi:MAG TPA: SDR family oxidoreductase [Chthoniobacterales bacterium]|nr:SDR family oxidoreductase [Chthoniobacterales bacterium]
MKLLTDKFALITGASQGLGREIALAYARESARGLALVARGREPLQELQSEIGQVAPTATVVTIQADLGSSADVERVAAITLEACGGRLDILVNNASTLGPAPMPYLLDYPADDFQQVLNVNLVAPFLLIQNLLAAMIDHGGSIVNVTSDAGRTGYPGWGAYGISKFGLEGLSQTWAAELVETPVRVNWVDPGNMNTAMHRHAEPGEDPTAWADPAAVTEIFVFLGSEAGRQVRGQRLEAQSDWRKIVSRG